MTVAVLLTALLSACAAPSGSTPGSGLPVTEAGTPTPSQAPTEPTSTPTSTEDMRGDDDLHEARTRWDGLALTSYRFRLTRLCFCPTDYVGPFDVTVTDGEVTDVVLVDPSAGQPPEDIPTIDELFDLILEDLQGGGVITGGGYGMNGLPVELVVDRQPMAIDDEVTYTAELLEDAPSAAPSTAASSSSS